MRTKLITRFVRSHSLALLLGMLVLSCTGVGLGTASARGATGQTHPTSLAALRATVRRRTLRVRVGRRVTVTGRVKPGTPGVQVVLLAGSRRRWRAVARARASASGRFELRFVEHRVGTRRLRLRAGRDMGAIDAGTLTGLVPRVASWYEDGGTTACRFHAHFGVANRTLPCGTRVTFVHDGHAVTARVDDRGPYVYGRDYDLNQNVAAALGVSGVATVLASR